MDEGGYQWEEDDVSGFYPHKVRIFCGNCSAGKRYPIQSLADLVGEVVGIWAMWGRVSFRHGGGHPLPCSTLGQASQVDLLIRSAYPVAECHLA